MTKALLWQLLLQLYEEYYTEADSFRSQREVPSLQLLVGSLIDEYIQPKLEEEMECQSDFSKIC